MILLTGGSGFVGQALINNKNIQSLGTTVVGRRPNTSLSNNIRQIVIGDFLPSTEWSSHVSGIDTVIHLAGRVHVMHETASDPLSEFRKTNTASTLNLASQAASSGVRRFIFLSSIKVNGEFSQPGNPFTPDDTHIPTDPYGLSKFEAEQGLRKLANQTGMEVVIIRPPLVYGPGVSGNFLSMIEWLQYGYPLPLGSIHNKRSFVALDNLIDLIITCIHNPVAANQTFLVSDGEDLSTTELLRRTGFAFERPVRLMPVPVRLLKLGAKFLGKLATAQRLLDSLQVDISKTRDLLDWEPCVTIDEALKKTAKAYLQDKYSSG